MPMLLSHATAAGVGTDPQRPRFEVADVVREYGQAFRATHHVSHEQEKVLQAIVQCRTAALGGHVEACETCGSEQICYNSCLMGSLFLWGVFTTKVDFRQVN
jgi:hypothetical protein